LGFDFGHSESPRSVSHLRYHGLSAFDVFVILRKADRHGNILRNANIPFAELEAVGGTSIDGVENPQDVPLINSLQFVGPSGILRASHRVVDASISKHNFPHHKHTSEEEITPGQIVKLDWDLGRWYSIRIG
jgi:hypothetical protein